MTEEELEKEVTEYLNTQTLPKIDSLVYRVIKNLIFGFAEPREKRNAELEEQIENMKCCGNCEHATHDSMNGTYCDYYSEWEHADLKCTQWELGR